jgi:hypothetical protein
MRRTPRAVVVVANVGAILLLVGCHLEVKDVGGLQAYVTDAECAKLRAIEMKAHFSDPASRDHLRVRALYSEAMAQANAFVASVRAGVDPRNPIIDVPKSRYDQHRASAELAEFLEETGRLRTQYFSRVGQELGQTLDEAVTKALEEAGDEQGASEGRAAEEEVEARYAVLQQKYADLQKASEELKATGGRQGSIVTEEYEARVVPEDYVPRVEQVTKDAAGLAQEALDLLAELQKELKGRDEELQKQAKQRVEASEAIREAAAAMIEHVAEPVPDSSKLMMQGTRVAVPVITSIVKLNGEVSRDGAARFDAIMEGIRLPDFDKLSAGTGDAPAK